MTKINQQETRAAALKEATAHPETRLNLASSISIDCGAAELRIKLGVQEHRIKVHEVLYTTSEFEPVVNGRTIGFIDRTEWLFHSDVGLVQIELNEELLSPLAQDSLSRSPWKYRVWAQTIVGEEFEEDKLLFELPTLQTRQPSVDVFEQLIHPEASEDFNLYRIFAGIAVSTLLGIDCDEYFDVTVFRANRPSIVLDEAIPLSLVPLK